MKNISRLSFSVIMLLAVLLSYMLAGCNNSSSPATDTPTAAYQEQSRYYLGDHIELPVRNQGDFGVCWTFAMLNSLETNLALQGKHCDFSEMHMAIWMAGDANVGGGDMALAVEYLFGSHGPVLEETVPYKLYSQEEAEKMNELFAVVKTNKLTIFSDGDTTDWEDKQEIITSIKQYIPYKGSVAVTIDASQIVQNDNLQMTMYTDANSVWNSDESHMVTLVGWDDSYSADNFPQENKPEHNGAFIALNSWGKEWGENGLFYISYDDLSVYTEMSAVGVTTEPPETVTGKFKDRQLYEAIKAEKYFSIAKYDDDTMEIEFYKDVLQSITILNLLDYTVTDLTGIEVLHSLELIYAERSKIKDESALYNLPNFDWEFWEM